MNDQEMDSKAFWSIRRIKLFKIAKEKWTSQEADRDKKKNLKK
jgi:hypothetical protein